jgi:phage protein U
MLYNLGAVAIDTTPFSIDEVERVASADFAVKPLVGTAPQREFMGEGDDTLTLSGQLLPERIGGLTELEALHGFRRAGQRIPVMRGDGKMEGWFVITEIREAHSELGRRGIGGTLNHTLTLVKIEPDGTNPSILGSLISLFGLL